MNSCFVIAIINKIRRTIVQLIIENKYYQVQLRSNLDTHSCSRSNIFKCGLTQFIVD